MKRFAKKKYSGDQKQEKVAKTSDISGSCTAFSISSVPVSASASTPGGEERPLSVKSLLKQKIQGKLSTVQEFDDSSCREGKQLEECCGNLESLGFVCELISLSDRHSPFLHEEKNSIPESALVVHASRDHTYNSKTGPFQPVRLVIFSGDFWRLQSTIYGFQDVTKGTLSSLGCEEVISLVSSWFSQFQSPVLANIRKGMEFFEGWCNTLSQTGMNIKYLRQRKEKLCNNITKYNSQQELKENSKGFT